jgi:hypothetical protein
MEGTLTEILEANPNKEFPCFPEINDAVIGVTEDDKLIYSEEKTLQIFMKNHSWSYDEALDWYCFNTACCFIGPRTPIFQCEEEE